ncbi:helix-turn-helix transcriptional regulator [Virgisporangium aliadipatigenens]|uniref:helix-turn-helix transcriptional regulator n=1 Tax=Virgisporangium aliadipatigenens TaxID=741659 RepID=UPI001942CE8B|nr:LuxR family transcriptional regulator [Virgisporangium aliadipatigenens]
MHKGPPHGRADQLKLIAALLTGAAQGSGGALVIQGDAGAGKTTLLGADVPDTPTFRTLHASGNEDESALPHAALHALLRPVLDRRAELPPEPAAALDGICGGARPAPLTLCLATLALLTHVAAEQPVLCRVDDLQWLDPESLQVLAFVARRLGGERVAMLFGVDEDEGAPAAGIPGVATVRLPEITPDAGHAILADLLPEGLPGDVAGALVKLAAGNPGALADLARSLTPEQRRGDTPPPPTLPGDSPLRARYRARLARLGPDTRRLLLLAAADPDLDVRELIAAADAADTDISSLEPAEAAGLIRADGAALAFRQPLLRSVTYFEATVAQRRDAHRLLARTLDRRVHPLRRDLHLAAAASGPDPALAAALERAAHRAGPAHAAASLALERAAELSADPPAAAADLVDAAHAAWLAGEPHRARLLLRRIRRGAATDLLLARAELLAGEIELRAGVAANAHQMLMSAARKLGTDDPVRAVDALILAGEALTQAGNHAEYPRVARLAAELRGPDPAPAQELRFAYIAGADAMFRGDQAGARGPLTRVVTRAPFLDDAPVLMRAAMAAILLGDPAKAHQLAAQAVVVARAAGDAVTVPHALEFTAFADVALGRSEAAVEAAAEGLHLARATGQENLAANHLSTLALLAAMAADRETCLARVRDARARAIVAGLGQPQAFCDWALAVLDLSEGRAAAAMTRLQGLMWTTTGHGSPVIQVPATLHLVEAAARCGEQEIARDALNLFTGWAQTTGNATWLALAARSRALLATGEGEAEKYFREALKQHLTSESPLFRAHTELLFGQELRRRRRPGVAREHLRSALETFRQLEAKPYIDQAAAELRAAGEHIEPRQVAVAGSLTPQQVQIAQLVADGATNREVAAQMFLSTRTVDHHLRNIFARLGVRSRTELARLMAAA